MVRRLAGTRAGHVDSLRHSPEPLAPPACVLVGDPTSPLSIIACSVHRATTSSTSRQAPPPMSVSRMSLTGAPLKRATADQPSQAGSMLRCLPPCRLGHPVPKGRPPAARGRLAAPRSPGSGALPADEPEKIHQRHLAGRHRQTAEREPDHCPAGARTTDWAVEAARRVGGGLIAALEVAAVAACRWPQLSLDNQSRLPPRRMRGASTRRRLWPHALENAKPSGCPQEWATSRR